MKQKNKVNGITLIALVITVIVLLILAGVTIAMLTGENGILKQAERAKEEYENAENLENIRLVDYKNEINTYFNNSRETVTINKEEYEELLELTKIEDLSEQITYNETYIDAANSYTTVKKMGNSVQIKFYLKLKQNISNSNIDLIYNVPQPLIRGMNFLGSDAGARVSRYSINDNKISQYWSGNTLLESIQGTVMYLSEE